MRKRSPQSYAMRKSLDLERQSATVDAVGQPVDTWSVVASRRGALEPLTGREYLAAIGQQTEVTTRIRMRYDSTIGAATAADRLVDNSTSPATVYDINQVSNIGDRNREVVFMCSLHG